MTRYEERISPARADWASAGADHLARYLYAQELVVPGARWVDAGTGAGYGAAMLHAAGATLVLGCDADLGVLAGAAREHVGGACFSVQDLERLALADRCVDVVCSFETIEHLQHPRAFVVEAARVLRDDGLLLCSTPDRASTEPFRDGRPANPHHIHEWYRGEFAALLAEGFDEVELKVQVTAFEFAARRHTVSRLQRSLAETWANPLMRIGRRLSAVRGHVFSEPDCRALATGRPADYPVLPASVAGLFGSPLCHVALCRRPRRDPC